MSLSNNRTYELHVIDSLSGCLFLRELFSFQWVANPVNDMYADAVLAVILQVESNPTTAQGKIGINKQNKVTVIRDATACKHVSFCIGFSLRTKIHVTFTSEQWTRRFGGNTATISITIVWNSYYEMFKAQTDTNVPPWASHNSYLKQQSSKCPLYRRKGPVRRI